MERIGKNEGELTREAEIMTKKKFWHRLRIHLYILTYSILKQSYSPTYSIPKQRELLKTEFSADGDFNFRVCFTLLRVKYVSA